MRLCCLLYCAVVFLVNPYQCTWLYELGENLAEMTHGYRYVTSVKIVWFPKYRARYAT